MRPDRALLALLALGTLPFAAAAATYKWIDDRGVVNYGNVPPPAGRQARQLDEDSARVSTIEAVPRAQLEREREALLRARIARLEAELEANRARAAAVQPVQEPLFVGPAPVAVYSPFWGVPVHRPRVRIVHRPPHPLVRGGVSVRIGGRR
jgi:uncharacterized small protein (DUF1192 family)